PDTLPPFGLQAALLRVNGKASLLHKLIVTFAATYAGAPDQLRAQIASGLLPDARRLAHSLKGVAGSLELPALQEAASNLERLLAGGDTEQAASAIAELQVHLTPAIAAAQSLTGGPAQTAPVPAPALDPEAAQRAQAELRELVVRRSLGARASFNRFAQAIGLSEEERARHGVFLALEKLDYGAALTLIDAASSPEGADMRLADREGATP
ncbi:Hpt domain-containing protein, partial [Novosphingobium sp. 18052]